MSGEELREICEKLHPSDIAWVLEALPLDERLALWNFVKSERDGEVLIEVNDGVRETLIDAMDRDELVDAVETLDTDEIADLVPDLPPDVTAEVQETLSLEERSQLRAAMSYPEDSVGSRMDFEMVSVREESTLAAVLAYLRRFVRCRITPTRCSWWTAMVTSRARCCSPRFWFLTPTAWCAI